MLTLHEKRLTRRYFLQCLDFLGGLIGFGLSSFGTLKSRCKLGLSSLRVTLQTLMFFHESLELLLYLRHPRLLLLSLGALRGRIAFAAATASFRVATSLVAPTIPTLSLSFFFATKILFCKVQFE